MNDEGTIRTEFGEENKFAFSCVIEMPAVYSAIIVYGKVSQPWHY